MMYLWVSSKKKYEKISFYIFKVTEKMSWIRIQIN
jgi:hypothetical protein